MRYKGKTINCYNDFQKVYFEEYPHQNHHFCKLDFIILLLSIERKVSAENKILKDALEEIYNIDSKYIDAEDVTLQMQYKDIVKVIDGVTEKIKKIEERSDDGSEQ